MKAELGETRDELKRKHEYEQRNGGSDKYHIDRRQLEALKGAGGQQMSDNAPGAHQPEEEQVDEDVILEMWFKNMELHGIQYIQSNRKRDKFGR